MPSRRRLRKVPGPIVAGCRHGVDRTGGPQEGDRGLWARRRRRVLPEGRRRICGGLPEIAQPVTPHSALEARATVPDLSPGHVTYCYLRQLWLREQVSGGSYSSDL